MARPGYIQARNHMWQLEERLKQLEENWAGELRRTPLDPDNYYRKTREAAIAVVRADYEAAKEAFAAFERPKIEHKSRTYYPVRLAVQLSISEELYQAIQSQVDTGRPLAEICREALTAYLLPVAR